VLSPEDGPDEARVLGRAENSTCCHEAAEDWTGADLAKALLCGCEGAAGRTVTSRREELPFAWPTLATR
jgi:hypothetical protein